MQDFFVIDLDSGLLDTLVHLASDLNSGLFDTLVQLA
jgi:hypothetical protein